MPRKVVQLDEYTVGEKPRPLLVQFDDSDIDLSAYSLAATLEAGDGTEETFTGTVEWHDASKGHVILVLSDDDLALAEGVDFDEKRLMVWTGNGTYRVATVLLLIPVYRGVGTVPDV